MNTRLRKTKVVATLGPACDSIETLVDMIRAGMNVARLNYSHGDPSAHRARLDRLAEATRKAGTSVATMLDTRGVEVRVGVFEDGLVDLKAGDRFVLHSEERLGDEGGVSVSYQGLHRAVKPGDPILIDDGSIALRVEAVNGGSVACRVRRGGVLRDRKGMNLPHTELQFESMGIENREEMVFATEHEFDYIAASFVRSAEDVETLRHVLEEHGSRIPIIAKIENRAGVANLEGIVSVADGTMVARGDLGVELPVEEVPSVQKQVIRETVMNGKPVITATQMLDSMERNPRPTRAEVSDVANAIFDGTSAVMLSGETAVGDFPVESVRTMAALALRAESSIADYGNLQRVTPDPSNKVSEAVSQAAITMANHLSAAAIVTLTETGFTSRAISKYRPACPILAVTQSPSVERRLCMNWGVTPVRDPGEDGDEGKIAFAIRRARELGYVGTGDVVVATAGLSMQAGSTDMIRVVTVE